MQVSLKSLFFSIGNQSTHTQTQLPATQFSALCKVGCTCSQLCAMAAAFGDAFAKSFKTYIKCLKFGFPKHAMQSFCFIMKFLDFKISRNLPQAEQSLGLQLKLIKLLCFNCLKCITTSNQLKNKSKVTLTTKF